jgi:Uma2 family endonuclease
MRATAADIASRPAQPDWLPRRRIDVDEYHRMGDAEILRREDRVELIDGELIAMSPIYAPHNVRVMTLTQLFVRAVADRAVISVQSPVRLNRYSEPEPDLLVLRPGFERYREALPTPADVLLLIEVADSSLRYDTSVKAALYGQHGVPEYWVIDIAGNCVLVHRGSGEAGYGTLFRAEHGDGLELTALPGLRSSVADLLA